MSYGDHSHDARDVGAARERHDHDALDVSGVAREDHSHTARDLSGTPTIEQFLQLQEQVGALTRQVSRMAETLLAEREVGAAVAGGATSVEQIAAAIERRARELIPEGDDAQIMAGLSRDPNLMFGLQLLKLAEEIRRDQS